MSRIDSDLAALLVNRVDSLLSVGPGSTAASQRGVATHQAETQAEAFRPGAASTPPGTPPASAKTALSAMALTLNAIVRSGARLLRRCWARHRCGLAYLACQASCRRSLAWLASQAVMPRPLPQLLLKQQPLKQLPLKQPQQRPAQLAALLPSRKWFRLCARPWRKAVCFTKRILRNGSRGSGR
ncbi:hypothetical protein [Paraburkholderia bonniea]|uniref:hypothetical protein n=1 Tax=Paraburkholderia bonniea TaxID=2152891 RepID=UPI001FE40AE0|nr:hypothetical protein [Paraburkholderia bonniea]